MSANFVDYLEVPCAEFPYEEWSLHEDMEVFISVFRSEAKKRGVPKLYNRGRWDDYNKFVIDSWGATRTVFYLVSPTPESWYINDPQTNIRHGLDEYFFDDPELENNYREYSNLHCISSTILENVREWFRGQQFEVPELEDVFHLSSVQCSLGTEFTAKRNSDKVTRTVAPPETYRFQRKTHRAVREVKQPSLETVNRFCALEDQESCQELEQDIVDSEKRFVYEPIHLYFLANLPGGYAIPERPTVPWIEEQFSVPIIQNIMKDFEPPQPMTELENFFLQNLPSGLKAPKRGLKMWVKTMLDHVEAIPVISRFYMEKYGEIPMTEGKTVRRKPCTLLMRLHMKKCQGHSWAFCHLNPEAIFPAVCPKCDFYLPRQQQSPTDYPDPMPMSEGMFDFLKFKVGPDEETTKRVDRMLDLLQQFSSQSEETVEKVLKAMKDATESADESVKSSMESLAQATKEMCETAKYVSDNGLRLNFGANLQSDKKEFDLSSGLKFIYEVGPSLLNLVMLFFLDLSVATKICLAIPPCQMLLKQADPSRIVGYLRSLFSGTPEAFYDAISEGPSFDDVQISGVFKILCLISGISFSKSDVLFQSAIDGFLRRASLLSRVGSGASYILEKIKLAFQCFVNFVCQKFGKEPIFVDDFAASVKPFFDLTDKLLAVKVDYSNVSEEWIEQIFESYRLGLALSRDLVGFRCPPSLLSALNNRLVVLRNVCNKCEAMGSLSKPRSPPLFVYLWGSSGVGKSTVVNSLQVDLAKIDKDVDPEEWCKNIYLRLPENEFADGARNGTFVEFYDDFAQLYDTQTKPDPSYLEIIRLGNIIPFPRHMADLSDKGKIFARPRIVFATSNLPLVATDGIQPVAIKSIQSQEAFLRRWDLNVRVSVNTEVVPAASVRDPVAKARALTNYQEEYRRKTGKPVDLNVYRFTLTYRGQKTTLNYREFINVVAHEYRKRKTQSEGYVDFLNKYAKEPFPDPPSGFMFAGANGVDFNLPSSEGPSVSGPDSDDDDDSFQSANSSVTLRELIVKYKDANVCPDFNDFHHIVDGIEDYRYSPEADNYCHELFTLLLLRFSKNLTPHNVERLAKFGFSAKNTPVGMARYELGFLKMLQAANFEIQKLPAWVPPEVVDATALRDLPRPLKITEGILAKMPGGGLVRELSQLKIVRAYLESDPLLRDAVKQGLQKNNANGVVSFKELVDWYSDETRCSLHLVATRANCNRAFRDAMLEYSRPSCPRTSEIFDSLFPPILYSDMLKFLSYFLGEFLDDLCFEHQPVVESTWKTVLKGLWNNGYGLMPFLPERLRGIFFLGLSAVGGAVLLNLPYIIISAVEFLFSQTSSVLEDLMPASESLSRGGVAPRRVVTESLSRSGVSPRRVATEGEDVPRTQSLTDNNAFAYCVKAARNARILKTGYGAEEKSLNGVLVKGRVFLTYRHYFNRFLEYARVCGVIRVCDANGVFIVSIPTESINFVFDPSDQFADRMIITLPRSVPAGSDILKAFVKLEELEKVNGDRVALVIPTRTNGNAPHFPSVCVQKSLCRYVYNDRYFDVPSDCIRHANLFQYECETNEGDCGSVLVSFNSTLPSHKLCGLHVASIRNPAKKISYPDKEVDNRVVYNGRAVVVAQEHIEKMISLLDCDSDKFSLNLDDPRLNVLPSSESDLSPSLPFSGEFHALGKVAKPVATEWSTSLIQTPITGVLQETKVKPAHLKAVEDPESGAKILPIYQSIAKAGNKAVLYDYEILKVCSDIVSNKISQNSAIKPFTMSFEQAVFGLQGSGLITSLTTSTSPGYPFCFMRAPQTGGKKTWIDFEKGFVSTELEKEALEVLEAMRKGIRPSVVWMDFGKDETRPIAKVDALKTRSINCSPLVFTIVCRMLYGSFCAAMVDGRIGNGSAIGLNPYSFEWSDLAFHLQKVGDFLIAGDFGNWDGGLTAELMWAGFDVMELWYRAGEEEIPTPGQLEMRVARRTAFEDIVHSCHVIGDDLYQWSHAMPSGTYLTAFLNTLINWIIFCYFCLISGMRASDFLKNVEGIVLGDDHVYSVSPKYSYLNQTVFKEFVQQHGMVYTDESKSDAEHVFRPLTEVEFLKRKFVFDVDLNRWMAPLSFDSIAEMMNWVRTKIPLPVALKLNYQCVLRELCMYNEEKFSECKRKMDIAFRKKGIVPDFVPPFATLRQEVTSGEKWPYDL